MLTNAKMSIDWGVSSSPGEVLSITVGDVFSGFGVTETLGKTEINDIDIVLLFADADEEVIGLDVSMKEVPWMYELDPLKLK